MRLPFINVTNNKKTQTGGRNMVWILLHRSNHEQTGQCQNGILLGSYMFCCACLLSQDLPMEELPSLKQKLLLWALWFIKREVPYHNTASEELNHWPHIRKKTIAHCAQFRSLLLLQSLRKKQDFSLQNNEILHNTSIAAWSGGKYTRHLPPGYFKDKSEMRKRRKWTK
jgi:hypothetical protein